MTTDSSVAAGPELHGGGGEVPPGLQVLQLSGGMGAEQHDGQAGAHDVAGSGLYHQSYATAQG